MLQTVGALLLLVLTGILGGYLSVQVKRAGWSPLWVLAPTASSTAIWAWMVRSHIRLTTASVLFDTVYGIAYFVGFLLMGETATWQQAVGVLLALAGLALVAS